MIFFSKKRKGISLLPKDARAWIIYMARVLNLVKNRMQKKVKLEEYALGIPSNAPHSKHIVTNFQTKDY